MKLYTEEQLRKTWNEGFRQGMSIDDETYEPVFFEHYLKFLIPIEVPTIKEIQKEADMFYHLESNNRTFVQGARLVLDKIQGCNI